MAYRTEEQEIDGHVWAVTTLPASVGMEVAGTLLRLVAPALEKAMGSVGGKTAEGLLDVELPELGAALASLLSGLGNPDDLAAVRKMLVGGKTPMGADYVPLRCDGKPVTGASFEMIFAGEYLTLLKVAKFAVEVNFKIPFASLLSAAGGVLGKIRAPTSRPAPSSGEK